MSIHLMSRVWSKQLGHNEQAVLLAMADHADDDGKNCYPSYAYVAWKTGYSERQVARIIKGLCDRGILQVVKAATRHQSPHYHIHIDKAKPKPPFRVDNLSTLDESRVDISDIEGGQIEQPGWTSDTVRVDIAVSTKPSVEPSIEPSVEPDPLAAPKLLTPQQEMFGAVCEAIGWDYRTLSKEDQAQVAQAVGILTKADYHVEDIQLFMTSVWFKDWRWVRDGSHPTLKQLRQEIGKTRSLIKDAAPPALSENKNVAAVQKYIQKRGLFNGRNREG